MRPHRSVNVVSGCSVRATPSEMPMYRANIIAKQTCRAVRRYFEQPGVAEEYEAWLKEYRKKKEA